VSTVELHSLAAKEERDETPGEEGGSFQPKMAREMPVGREEEHDPGEEKGEMDGEKESSLEAQMQQEKVKDLEEEMKKEPALEDVQGEEPAKQPEPVQKTEESGQNETETAQ